MKRSFWRSATILHGVVAVLLSLGLAEAKPAFSQTSFSDVDPYFGDAANWQPLHAARWSVVMDGGDLRYGINTTSYSELSGSRLGEYSLVKGRIYGDFVLTASARSTEDFTANGWADHDVVFGFQDANNYYYAMINRYAPFTQLFKVVAGQRQTLADSTYAIPDNDYHQIEVSRAGTLLTVKVDGAVIMQANDATFGPGRIGIGSFDDAALWDDIAIAGPFSTLDPYLGDAANWEPLNASRWSTVMDGGDLRYGITTTKYSELSGSRLGEYSLVKGRTYGDFVLSAWARSTENFATNGWADHDVVFGFQDGNNYYYAMISRYAPFTQLFKVVAGQRQTLANSSYSIPDNDYHQIEVSRAASLITVKVDGAVIMQANDATFGAGRVGVGSFDDGALWDDITVAALPFSTLDPYLDDAANWQPLNPSTWSTVMDGGDLRYGIITKTPELPGSRLGAYSLVKGRTYGDFVLTTRARSTEDFIANGWADHDVVFGFQDANNYYYAMFNRYAPFTQLFKVVGGQRQTLADGNYALPDNDYHQFEVSRAGTLITVKADGVVIMQANDATFGAGLVGVGSFDDTALWDDITVSVPSAPVPVLVVPTISFSAVPATIAAGQSATITWSSSNATSCSASAGWSGTLPTSGSQAVAPTATTTYVLTCTGAGGVASMSALVSVTVMPTVSLTASPANIAAGASSTLTWSSTDAGSCTATGGWSGAKATSGSLAVSPSLTTSYALSCTGAGGTASQSAMVTVAAAAQVTPSLVPSRVSGVAPLYVFFDATDTTGQATTRPFHDLEYRWDFGDPASGSWTSTANMPNLSRNADTGPVGAHLFETPGTYTVSLTVLDGMGMATKSVQITVADPDTVFAASTLCVGNSLPVAGAGGCPAGAAVLASGDFDAAVNNNLAGRQRILFRRGDTFTSSASAVINLDGPGLIGAFGSGAAPRVSITGNNYAIQVSSGSTPGINDWRVMDLEIDGNSGSATQGIHAEGGIDQVTLLRLNIHHVHEGMMLSPDTLDFYGPLHTLWDQWALVDSTVRNAIGGAGGYVLYFSGQRCAVIGNVLSDSTAAEHVLRTPYIFKGVFSHNDMSKSAAAKHVVKMQAASWFAAAPSIYTEQIVFADNKFTSGDAGGWTVTIGPMDSLHDERVRQVILERNWFAPGTAQDTAMMLWAQDITVRNNVFNLTGAVGQNAMVVDQRGIEPPPANVHVYNNTFYSGSAGAGGFFPIAFALGTGMEAKNNLAYAPLSSSRDMVAGSAIIANNTTDAGILVSPGFVGLTPVVPADFALGALSSAINAGTTVPVFSDLFRNNRPQHGAFDLGATESP